MSENKRPRKIAKSRYSNREVEWIQSDWFCPKCGKRDMWQEGTGGGDYYHDNTVTCHSCRHDMCCVDTVRDEPEVKAPWWDEVSAQKVGYHGTQPVSEASGSAQSEAQNKNAAHD